MSELSNRVLARSEHNSLPALDRLKMRLKALTTPDGLEHFNDSKVLAPGYARQQNEMAEHIGREKPYGRDEESEIQYRDVYLVKKYRKEQQAEKGAKQPKRLRKARQEYTDEFIEARRQFERKEKVAKKKRKKEEEEKQKAEPPQEKPAKPPQPVTKDGDEKPDDTPEPNPSGDADTAGSDGDIQDRIDQGSTKDTDQSDNAKPATSKSPTEAEIKVIEASRKLSDQNLKEDGARLMPNRGEHGKFVKGPSHLVITKNQWDAAHQEMEENMQAQGGTGVTSDTTVTKAVVDADEGHDGAGKPPHQEKQSKVSDWVKKIVEQATKRRERPEQEIAQANHQEPQLQAEAPAHEPQVKQAVSRFILSNGIKLRGSERREFTDYVKKNDRTEDVERAYDDYLKMKHEQSLVPASLLQILRTVEQNTNKSWTQEFVKEVVTLARIKKPGLLRKLPKEQRAVFDQVVSSALDHMSDISSYQSDRSGLLESASSNMALAEAICNRKSPARKLLAQQLEDFICDDYHATHWMHEYERVGRKNALSLFSLTDRNTSFYKGVLAAFFRNKGMHPTELANVLGIPEVREILKQAVSSHKTQESEIKT